MTKLSRIHRNYITIIGFLIFLFSVYEYNNNLQKHIIEDQNKLITAFEQSPNFHWLKDSSFVMIALNPAYEKELLTPYSIKESDYIGFTDFDVWDHRTASIYRKFDKDVLDCYCPIQRNELATRRTLKIDTIVDSLLGYKIDSIWYIDTLKFSTVKFPVIFADSSVGVGGTAFFNIK